MVDYRDVFAKIAERVSKLLAPTKISTSFINKYLKEIKKSNNKLNKPRLNLLIFLTNLSSRLLPIKRQMRLG